VNEGWLQFKQKTLKIGAAQAIVDTVGGELISYKRQWQRIRLDRRSDLLGQPYPCSVPLCQRDPE